MVRLSRAFFLAFLGVALTAPSALPQVTFAPDAAVTRIELVQTAQDDGQNIPLLAGKTAVARVFLQQLNRPDSFLANVTVSLRGYRGGTELPESPLRPLNPPLRLVAEPSRFDENHSQQFVLPVEWTAEGALELRAELRVPAGVVEFPQDNNTLARTFEFVPAPPPYVIGYLPVCLGALCPSPDIGQYAGLASRLFPVPDGGPRYVPAGPGIEWEGAPGVDLTALLKKWRFFLDDPARLDQIVGWLPRQGDAVSGGDARAAWIAEQPDPDRNRWLLARESAKGFGLAEDAGCAEVGDAGFDPRAARFVAPSRPDFLSSCGFNGGWTGVGRYWALLDALRAPGRGGAAVATPANYVIVGGNIGDNRLDAAWRVSSRVPGPPSDPDGNTCLRFTGEAAEQDYCFSPATDRFVVKAPLPPGTNVIRLRRGGADLAALTASGAAPEVSLVLPPSAEPWTGRRTINWTGGDAGGRELTYALFASGDDGLTWQPVAVDLRRTQYTVDTARLAGSSVRFRLLASAGLDQAEVISDPVPLSPAPAAEAVSSAVEFGNITVGQAAERGAVVRNAGSGPLAITGAAPESAALSVVDELPLIVPAGERRAVTVRFRPSLPGSQTANLTLETNDPARPSLRVVMTGNAFDRPVPTAAVAPTRLDFGDVTTGQSRELSVTVANSGNGTLTVSAMSTLNARFAAAAPTTPFNVAPGARQDVAVRFSPNAAGAQEGSLSITTNDPGTPNLRVALTGTGVVPLIPALEASSTALDFGSVPIAQTRSLSLTLRNSGNGALTVTGLTLSNPQFAVLGLSVPFTLAPAAQQVVPVRYGPTAQGSVTGTLEIQSNDPARPRVAVTLRGTGLPAQTSLAPTAVSVSPASLTQGSPRFNLTVTGTNFNAGSVVRWNGSDRPTSFLSETELRASIPAEDVAAQGVAAVTVSNPAPGGGVSGALSVYINSTGARGAIVQTDPRLCPTVLATLHATDLIGNAITLLSAGNLRCTEGGVRYNCNVNRAADMGVGLSVYLVLHASASALDPRQQILDLQRQTNAALAFTNALEESARVAIVQMDNGVRPLRDFTEARNREALRDAIQAPLPVLGSGAALYDAVEDGLNRLATQQGRRKAIVLFSSSGNTFNTAGVRDLDALIRRVQSSGVPIFVMPLGPAFTETPALSILNQLALDSYGQIFADPLTPATTVAERLAAALSNQQQVNYNGVNSDGRPRLLLIEVETATLGFRAARYFPGCR